jgi:Zn-dependent alcohol dehydrogenase
MHTMAKVKNEALAEGDTAEPAVRLFGEEQVVQAADLLIANTETEARQLVDLYERGLFPFDRLLKSYPFSEINTAFDDSASGVTLKPVVIF